MWNWRCWLSLHGENDREVGRGDGHVDASENLLHETMFDLLG